MSDHVDGCHYFLNGFEDSHHEAADLSSILNISSTGADSYLQRNCNQR